MTTRELIDNFFNNKTADYARKIRRQVDRPELFEYEKEIGKPLVMFTADDIMKYLSDKVVGVDGKKLPFSTIYSIVSTYRTIVDWYCTENTPVYNAWRDKRFRAQELSVALTDTADPFTTEDMEDFIKGIRRTFEPEKADYMELMTRLFYSGFPKAADIIAVKEEAVIPKKRAIYLPNYRMIELDERTFNLAVRVHEMDVYPGKHFNYVMTPYHGSYFKVPTRANECDKLNDKDIFTASVPFNRCIRQAAVETDFKKEINYLTLYYLGFYDTMVKKYGRERTNKILTTKMNKDYAADYQNIALEYRLEESQLSQFKNKIVAFIH